MHDIEPRYKHTDFSRRLSFVFSIYCIMIETFGGAVDIFFCLSAFSAINFCAKCSTKKRRASRRKKEKNRYNPQQSFWRHEKKKSSTTDVDDAKWKRMKNCSDSLDRECENFVYSIHQKICMILTTHRLARTTTATFRTHRRHTHTTGKRWGKSVVRKKESRRARLSFTVIYLQTCRKWP